MIESERENRTVTVVSALSRKTIPSIIFLSHQSPSVAPPPADSHTSHLLLTAAVTGLGANTDQEGEEKTGLSEPDRTRSPITVAMATGVEVQR